MRPGEQKIFNALLKAKNPQTFTQLLESTKLSRPALSGYLKTFQNTGLAVKDKGTGRYHLPDAKKLMIESLDKEGEDVDYEEIKQRKADDLQYAKNLFVGSIKENFMLSIINELREESPEEYDLTDEEVKNWFFSSLVNSKNIVLEFINLIYGALLAAPWKDYAEKEEQEFLTEIKHSMDNFLMPHIESFMYAASSHVELVNNELIETFVSPDYAKIAEDEG